MSVHNQEEERRKYQIPESKTSHKTNGRTKDDEIYQKRFISNVLIMNVNNQTPVIIELLNVYKT